jgi:hypothetical protein
MKYVDLHIHTNYSDGTDSPSQLIRLSKMKGLDMIAIADHDNLSGYYAGIKEAKRWNIALVPAVEITTIEAHLLGLNFNVKNSRFRGFVKYSQEVHNEVCAQRIEKLRAENIPITFEKVRNAFPYSSLGKYSIIWTMLLDDECRIYLDKNIEDRSFKNLFKVYLSKSGIAGSVEKKRAIHWNETVFEVKKAGGLVIFPHPPKSAHSPLDIQWLLKSVDGLEVQPKYAKESLPFIKYATEKNLLITYGSDYHSMYGGSSILGKEENQINEGFAELLTNVH